MQAPVAQSVHHSQKTSHKAASSQLKTTCADSSYAGTVKLRNRSAGREKDRNFNDVSYEELKNVTKDAKRYGSGKRLITVAQAAEMKATTNVR